jgi:hypothetical protein
VPANAMFDVQVRRGEGVEEEGRARCTFFSQIRTYTAPPLSLTLFFSLFVIVTPG